MFLLGARLFISFENFRSDACLKHESIVFLRLLVEFGLSLTDFELFLEGFQTVKNAIRAVLYCGS